MSRPEVFPELSTVVKVYRSKKVYQKNACVVVLEPGDIQALMFKKKQRNYQRQIRQENL